MFNAYYSIILISKTASQSVTETSMFARVCFLEVRYMQPASEPVDD